MLHPRPLLVASLATVLIAGCADPGKHSQAPSKPPIAPTPVAPVVNSNAEQAPQTAPLQRLAKRSLLASDAVQVYAPAMLAPLRQASGEPERENYAPYDSNSVKRVAQEPVSTFSVDVDTGSYSNVRRMLHAGHLPVQDAVRVEELINYFDYDYPVPGNSSAPFSVTTEVGPNPWNENTQLLNIGIKGYEVAAEDIPAANLVFLIDVSGSMQSPDKLDLLKKGMKLLTRQLRASDRVSIVVYAGASGVVLEPTPGNERFKINQALDQLTAGGSTNGAAGIRLAYEVAQSAYIKDGVNRILLATDGDFNVGTTDFEQLIDLVENRRASGIGLSTLGFGSGNYNDHLAEQLANKGNGVHAYIDTLNEASKVLVEQLSSTLLTIARDVKIQIEFNPSLVAEYRLIGYENRQLRREDFNNDRIDAGEIGAGHTVTAIYEITLKGSGGERIEPLRYANGKSSGKTGHTSELAWLRLRYKRPGRSDSESMETPVYARDVLTELAQTTPGYRFAAAVAAFGQHLRGGRYLEQFGIDQVLQLARAARGKDSHGYRGEFIQLVSLAQQLEPVTP